MRPNPDWLSLGATITLGLLLLFGFAQIASAQAPTPLPLSLDNNYMVTGDYVVGGWMKATTSSGTSTGTIGIPDSTAYGGANLEERVPAGADIVAAFLYWATVESSGVHSGQNGFFSGSSTPYPIVGTVLGNPNAPVSWSSGGCAGAANGSKTIVTYRADVSALLPVDANGNVQPNATYTLSLPDTGKAGQPPFALGATLVIVYRVLAPSVPLNAVIIYDGAYAPSNSAQTTTQPMIGFYDAGNDQEAAIATKITHIVANGQNNKLQSVMLNNAKLASLYGNLPPFPGMYNGSWDNPTWTFQNGTNGAVNLHDFSATTYVVPASSNKGCVSWGAIVMSTTVRDSDHDGLPDASKASQGYYDAGANRGMSNQGTCTLSQGICIAKANDPSWVALSGATPGEKDIFIQLDYMCSKVNINNPDGTNTTCDPSGVSYRPSDTAISNLENAFSPHNIKVHVVSDDTHVILAQPCQDQPATQNLPAQYCPFSAQAGVVGWKYGYSFYKSQPLNTVYPDDNSCATQTPVVNGVPGTPGTGPTCQRRFPHGQNNTYHEVIFAGASATPEWTFFNGSITGVSATLPPVCAPLASSLTFTTATAHGLVVDPNMPSGRVTVSGAISNPGLNETYLVQCTPTPNSFTIQVASGTTAPTSTSDPAFSLTSGVLSTASGVSDIGGADSLVSLGLWGVDGQSVQVESGTMMHELGHSLGLTHGGLFITPLAGGDYSFSFEPNCKPNYQSVMNYLFQVDLLDGNLDYSGQTLPLLNENLNITAGILNSTGYVTTKWYTPNQPFVGTTSATSYCDGTPLPQMNPPTMYRVQGPASSLGWLAGQDINFDGKIEQSLDGYDDWAPTGSQVGMDPRQVGATGNDFWVAGGVGLKPSGGGVGLKPSGGGVGLKPSGGGVGLKPSGGGVGEITVLAASSFVRNPTNLSATLTGNTVLLTWTPPSIFQSQIVSFNLYRSVNGAAFALYKNVPVTGTPPLSNQTYTDTAAACATYAYLVTTVAALPNGSQGQSVQSNEPPPVSVPCLFSGFFSPLTTAGTLSAPSYSGQRTLGNAAPIKWEITDGNGNPISDLTTLKSIQACPASSPTGQPAASPCVLICSSQACKGNTTYRFSSPDFIINWDTSSVPSHGYWTIELQLNDGSPVKATTILF
jgi:hypothetical protein